MAKVVVGAEVKVEAKGAEQSVGNIKRQLKEANAELIQAQQNFGNYSAEAVEAARKVADLRDRVQEARETADLFDPGKKFQAAAGAVSTVTAGFSALQGAQALLGDESEELQKTMVKLQAALNLSQGLSAIADGAKDFQRLGAIVKGPVIAAFTTLRGALIATGIGALAVGVGMLIANFDKVKQAVLNFIPGLQSVGKFIGSVVNSITDFIGVTSEAERALDKLIKTNDRLNESSEARIRILQAQGGKEKEIFEERAAQNERELNVLRTKLKETGKLSDEELKKFRELNNEKTVIFTEEQTRLSNIQKDNANKAAEDQKKANDDQVRKNKEKNDQIQKDNEAALKRQLALIDRLNDEIAKRNNTAGENQLRDAIKRYAQDLEEAGNNEKAKQLARINFLQASTEAERAIAKEQKDAVKTDEDEKSKIKINADFITRNTQLQAAASFGYSETKIKKANDEVQKKLDKQKTEEFVNNISGALNQISDILGQQSALGKAVAVASAIINTYQGATKALAQTGVFGFISAAAVIAAGFKSVKQILATKIPGAKGGPVVGATNALASAAAPIRPEAATTRLDQQSINAVGNAAAGRAYVLETDVSSNQERIRRLNRAARIN